MDLKKWREKQKKTQAEAARIFGVTPVTFCRWERGIRTPRPSMLRKIRKITENLVTANDFADMRIKEQA